MVQVAQPGNDIALFSPPNALELFYLCKVIESGIAEQDIHDTQNHVIKEGCSYLTVCYYKKSQIVISVRTYTTFISSLGSVVAVYILPAHVMAPEVDVTFIATDIH